MPTGPNVVVVTLAVLPRTCAAVAQVTPSVLVCTSKSRVLNAAFSPPAPACRITTRPTETVASRSTRHHFEAPSEHHLSALPPLTVPFTALAGPSVEAHWLSAVAALFSARFVTGGTDPPVRAKSSTSKSPPAPVPRKTRNNGPVPAVSVVDTSTKVP